MVQVSAPIPIQMSPLEPPVSPPLSMSPPHSITGFKTIHTNQYPRNIPNPPRQSSYATIRADHLHAPPLLSPANSATSFSSSSSASTSTGKQKWKLVKNIFTIVKPEQHRPIQRRNSSSSNAPSTIYSQSSSNNSSGLGQSNNSSAFNKNRPQVAKPMEAAKRSRMKVFRKDTAPSIFNGKSRPEIVHPTLKQRPTHKLHKSQSQPDLRDAAKMAKRNKRAQDELYTHFPLPFKQPTAMLTTLPKIDRKSGEFPGDIHIHIPLPITRWNFGLDDDIEDDMLEMEPSKKTHTRKRSMTAPSQTTTPMETIVFGGDRLYAEPEEIEVPSIPVSPPRPRFAIQQSRQNASASANAEVGALTIDVPRHQRQRSNSTPITPSELVKDAAPLSLAAAVERLRGRPTRDHEPASSSNMEQQQPVAQASLSSTTTRRRSQTMPTENVDIAPLPLSVAMHRLRSKSIRTAESKSPDSDANRTARRRSQSLNGIPPDYAAAHVPRTPYSNTGIVPIPSPSPPHSMSPIVVVQKPTLEDGEPYKSIAASLLSSNLDYEPLKQVKSITEVKGPSKKEDGNAVNAEHVRMTPDQSLLSHSNSSRNEVPLARAIGTERGLSEDPKTAGSSPRKLLSQDKVATIPDEQKSKSPSYRQLDALLSPRASDLSTERVAGRFNSGLDVNLSPRFPKGKSKKKSKLDQLLQELGAAELEFLEEQKADGEVLDQAVEFQKTSPEPKANSPSKVPQGGLEFPMTQPLPTLKVWPSPSSKQNKLNDHQAYKIQPTPQLSVPTLQVQNQPIPPRSPSPKGYKAIPGKHFESFTAEDSSLIAGRRKTSIPSIDPGLLLPPISTSPTHSRHPFDSQMVKATSPLDSLMNRMASSPMFSPDIIDRASSTSPIGSPPPMSGRLQQPSYFSPQPGGHAIQRPPIHLSSTISPASPMPMQLPSRTQLAPVQVEMPMLKPIPIPIPIPMRQHIEPSPYNPEMGRTMAPRPAPVRSTGNNMPHPDYMRTNQIRQPRRVEIDPAGHI